jgi:sarcosine oxidase subunit alpha
VDFQHDVTLRDIDIAVQENYISVEHMKRYTTTGMSVDQGKTSNLNALLALAQRTQRSPTEIGTTTFRPFYTPVTLGAIAGRRRGQFYAPIRRSPITDAAARAGALFQDYGIWRRPAAYPRRHEEPADAIQREARAVRQTCGIYDASPLGKIEVRGPDAGEFLNRIYVNNVLSMKSRPGQARYGIMLDDNGVIMDDGILVCINSEHFLLHPSSAHAERVYAWLEEWHQGEWQNLRVLLTPVTSQWATVALSGPKAREVLRQVAPTFALPDRDFPHMHWRAGQLHGVPVRILRASFTGELGFEISVPADYGAALWEELLVAGKPFGITPFGVEALLVLRTEKGYLHVGSDTDGTTTPDDIGWGNIVARKKADFIGKRSLQRPHNRRTDRLQFVALGPLNPRQPVTTGAHVVDADVRHAPAPTQGYVTSACFSPNLERWIALGLVRKGRERIGKTVNLFHADRTIPARIVSPTLYDPEGARLHD